MRERRIGMRELEAVFRERQRVEERSRERQRKDGRADVVHETRFCERR
jgi:hypothetical protein